MVDTLTLNNNGTAAWEVTTFSGAGIITQIGVTNPDIELTGIGTRYEITNDGYPAHPLEFLDDQNNVLLSQSSTGSYESDGSVNWVDNDTSVEFTLTQGLSNQLTTYRCTVHTGAMVGNIISPEIDYTPNTGSVSITSPAEGDVVTSPFDVVMSATNFTVEAASNPATNGAGHFHILVDQPAVAPGQAIPNNPANGYYHYGDGSTTATLDLDPGTTTIRIQAGTSNHLAYDLTDSVDIIVESDIQGTPIINAIDNANQASLETVFAAVAADPTARDNLSQSDRNIDKVSTNVGVIETLNNNEEAIRKMLCRREERDPANFADLNAVAADQGLMQAIAARQESSKILARSQTASAAAAAAATAMSVIGNSATARSEVYASPTAMSEIRPVDQAIAKLSAGEGGADASSVPDMATLAGDASAMQVLAASQTGMQEVAASQTAMQAVAASQTAMQEVAASQTAMQEVAASQTAMQALAASQTAIDAIGSNNNASITENTVLNSTTAAQELVTSPLEQTFERTYSNAYFNAPGTITNQRVIVTSNNNSGQEFVGINFGIDVGPETQVGSTFIINEANANQSGNGEGRDGTVSINGIIIN